MTIALWATTLALPSQTSSQQQLLRIQEKLRAGDLESASADLRTALAQSPSDPRLFNFRGVLEAQQNQFAAAESSFRKAIGLAPRFIEAHLNLGRLYQEHLKESGSLEKAIAVYQAVLKLDPDHVQANFQMAWLLNRSGAYAASLGHLSRLPAQHQQRAAALALLVANSVALGKSQEAEAAVARLLTAPDLAEIDVTSIAPVLLKNRRDDLTARMFETLATKGLASDQSLIALAAIGEKQGKRSEVRATLERSLLHRRQPPSVALLAQMARLAYAGHDLEGALGYLARARDLEPKNAAIHFFFGMICVELKLPPEAKASLQEALRLQPENPDFNYAMGAVLIGQKNADEAIAYFQKFHAARPADPRGTFALGVAYFEAYQLDRARDELLKIASNPETRYGAHLYLGRVAMATQEDQRALTYFEQAIAANPAAPDAYAEAALVRIRRSEYAQAQENLSKALAQAPDHYLSNLRLLMLYQKTKDARTEDQTRRVEDLRKIGEEKERLLLRSLEIRP